MKYKNIIIISLLFLLSIPIYSNQFNFNNQKTYNKSQIINNIYNFQSSKILDYDNYAKKDKKDRIRIFDKPDFSWFKEKNRLEKLLIASGAVTCTIGFGMLLAGLINYFVPFNAVSVDGEPIPINQITSIVLMGVGGGLMGTGTGLIIAGTVKLGLKKRKAKLEQNKTEKKEESTPESE